MATIAFILLCHKEPGSIIRQAEQLTASGDMIAIHFDAASSRADWAEIQAALKDNPNVAFATRRIKCGWGEWSLVQATLYAIEAAVESFPRATHFYMVSGDCMAIKSASYAHKFLDERDCDYIESVDFFDGQWIKTGFKEERLIYRHYFNERRHKALFYASINLQRRLGMRRTIPRDIEVKIGSQWWCLRRRTIEAILEFTTRRRDVMRFFRSTWIPDETFFQTLVRHIVPRDEIEGRTLTFLLFSDYGMPVTFYNDHYNLLLGQDGLFARKISPEANVLKDRLGQLYASGRMDFTLSGEGRAVFKFLTGRGRIGQRFSVRFWENKTSLGRDREVLLIMCKKWHVAKRLIRAIEAQTGINSYGYIFDEDDTPLPDLGGIEKTLQKRQRHRRALVRLLLEHNNSDRLVFCVDPSRKDLIADFYSDRSKTRLLDIRCDMSDAYVAGHAARVGLAGAQTGPEALATLIPTLRRDMDHEGDVIQDMELPDLYRLFESHPPEIRAQAVRNFLSISDDQALKIMQTPYLFSD